MTLPFPVHVALASIMVAGSAIGFYIDATFGTRFYAGEVGAAIAVPYVLLIAFGRLVFPDVFATTKAADRS
ncbi:hypothetical protein [Sphingomonas sp. FARSPH]|uniref:hypothetical protein n=1 Tax=Sphingomonas sp. FARSPH TaxID=2219696 RepID=UPI000E10C03F|nr:hypothetical protein [Sphingomonas sp. FARSPH]AXJ97487.1 hypothetical protein DM480_17535 [Sphingomonas sp. FARSPH]